MENKSLLASVTVTGAVICKSLCCICQSEMLSLYQVQKQNYKDLTGKMKASPFQEDSFPMELFLTVVITPAIAVISVGCMLEKCSQSQVAQISHRLINCLRI